MEQLRDRGRSLDTMRIKNEEQMQRKHAQQHHEVQHDSNANYDSLTPVGQTKTMHESTLVQIRGTTARLAEEHLEYIAGLLLAASGVSLLTGFTTSALKAKHVSELFASQQRDARALKLACSELEQRLCATHERVGANSQLNYVGTMLANSVLFVAGHKSSSRISNIGSQAVGMRSVAGTDVTSPCSFGNTPSHPRWRRGSGGYRE